MTVDLVKARARLKREKFDQENAKGILNIVKRAMFVEYTKSLEFKQLR